MVQTLDNTSVKINATTTLKSTGDLSTASDPLSFAKAFVMTNGTGANNANMVFADTRTLAASGTEDLDLAGGVTNSFGTTTTFTKIKALIISAAAGNTNDVVVGGHATAAITSLFGDATDKVKVKPGGTVAFVAPDATGYAITATTADMLTVTNSAGTTGVTYDIVVIGVV